MLVKGVTAVNGIMMMSWHGNSVCITVLYLGNPLVTVDCPEKVPVMQGGFQVFVTSLNKLFQKQLCHYVTVTVTCDITVMHNVIYQSYLGITANYLIIFVKFASRALGQSYDYPRACEVILKDTGKSSCNWPQKHIICVLISLSILY